MNNMIPGSLANIIILRNDRPTEIFYRQGDNMPFVQAEVNDHIKVRVSTAGPFDRMEVYMSVDGRSVHRNRPADFLNDRGYILDGQLIIEGYRLDNGTISPFKVTYPSNSVAAWTSGNTDNAGVIGLAFFREKEVVMPMNEAFTKEVFSLGGGDTLRKSPVGMTGDGTKVSHVVEVPFTRATYHPTQVTQIQYRPLWWLKQEGIIRAQSNDPNPFPGNDDTGYGFLRK